MKIHFSCTISYAYPILQNDSFREGTRCSNRAIQYIINNKIANFSGGATSHRPCFRQHEHTNTHTRFTQTASPTDRRPPTLDHTWPGRRLCARVCGCVCARVCLCLTYESRMCVTRVVVSVETVVVRTQKRGVDPISWAFWWVPRSDRHVRSLVSPSGRLLSRRHDNFVIAAVCVAGVCLCACHLSWSEICINYQW